MEMHNLAIGMSSIKLAHAYKNVVDRFGGVDCMAECLGVSKSTVYKWISGQTMSLTYAIRIHLAKPEISLKELIGYELQCEPIYLKILGHFGTQSATAKALGLSQFTVRAWLMNELRISLKKASLLEEITQGKFHLRDFPNLMD